MLRSIINTLIISVFAILTLSAQDSHINWLSWEQAMTKHKEAPKKLYIDIYTEWCGYCKKMDKTTFTDPEVVEMLNTEYYPIKFDAEQKEQIDFNGHEFIYRDGKPRGVHELAISLTNSQLAYPAFVMLDETFARILISPGYKEAPEVMKELHFGKDEAYKYSSFDDYKPNKKKNRKGE